MQPRQSQQHLTLPTEVCPYCRFGGSAAVAMTTSQPKRDRPDHDEPDAEDEVEEVGPTPPQETQRDNIVRGAVQVC